MDSNEELSEITDHIVLRHLIENTLKYASIPEVREKLIEPALRRLGLSYEEPSDLELAAMTDDFKEYFGLEMHSSGFGPPRGGILFRSALSAAELSPGVDRTLIGWARAEPAEFALIAGPRQYNSAEGHTNPPQTRLRDGQMVHTGQSYFYCRYRDRKILVSLKDHDVQVNGEPQWFWSTAVEWAERPRDAASFIKTLSDRIEGYLVSERKGRILSSTYQPISLRTYRLGDLAYPAQLREDVEDLIAAFDKWQSPECTVSHWGAALVGKPGTGKTTIAGVLTGRKQPDCTVLYCPAHDFVNMPPGRNIQTIVRDVFSWARRLAPTLLIVDDLDLIVPARGSGYLDAVTSCFMENLDSLSSTTKLFLVITTNRPDVVESAILDRPGRVGTRIRFEKFDACFPELLQCQAKLHGLQWNDSEISGIEASDDYRALMSSMEVTPDIAKNVMQRVTLSKNGTLARKTLANALRATRRSFGTVESTAA